MNFNIAWIWQDQQALITLASSLVLANIFTKVPDLLGTVSPKTTLVKLSLIGILPVEGRLTLSLPLIPRDKEPSEVPMGVLAYLATHHYYLWSPLEKSVIIILAGLQISYATYIYYTGWLLGIYFMYFGVLLLIHYIPRQDEYEAKALMPLMPFLVGLLACLYLPSFCVMPVVVFLYAFRYRNTLNLSYSRHSIFSISKRTIVMVAFLIFLSSVLKGNQDSIKDFIPSDSLPKALLVSLIFSVVFGSSTKYAGVVVLLTSVYGMKFFPVILAVEFAGYLVSPIHKCTFIAMEAYGAPIKKFYTQVGLLGVWIVIASLYSILVRTI